MMQVVTLHRNEIAYDVEVASWRIAKTHFAEDLKSASEGKISDDVADWLDRQISSAVSEVKRKIAFAVTDKNTMSACNGIGDCDDCDCSCGDDCDGRTVLYLRFGEGWRGNLDVLVSDIHDYVVSTVLFQWLVMTAPAFANVYEAKADRHLDRIVSEARSEVIRTPRFVL
jgi:hypothetical protein